jgi:hypothetical protein
MESDVLQRASETATQDEKIQWYRSKKIFPNKPPIPPIPGRICAALETWAMFEELEPNLMELSATRKEQGIDQIISLPIETQEPKPLLPPRKVPMYPPRKNKKKKRNDKKAQQTQNQQISVDDINPVLTPQHFLTGRPALNIPER